ncbi:MAG: hypothetical protein OXI27_02425 [Thaumarchaeota archaeon]|nr:hypothetical protein [Nitrososphaerota archaeon]
MAEKDGGGLAPEFADWLDGYVGQMLDIHRMARPAHRTADVWGCRNVGDFMCGFFVGEMIGAATSALQSRYGREPTAQEHAEIAGIVEKRSDSIRDAFLRFN